MKKIILPTLVLLLLAGASMGTFFATRHYIFAQAYATGNTAGFKDGSKQGYKKGYDRGRSDEEIAHETTDAQETLASGQLDDVLGNEIKSPTAKCNDGILSYSANHSGTCSSHKGVAIWYR